MEEVRLGVNLTLMRRLGGCLKTICIDVRGLPGFATGQAGHGADHPAGGSFGLVSPPSFSHHLCYVLLPSLSTLLPLRDLLLYATARWPSTTNRTSTCKITETTTQPSSSLRQQRSRYSSPQEANRSDQTAEKDRHALNQSKHPSLCTSRSPHRFLRLPRKVPSKTACSTAKDSTATEERSRPASTEKLPPPPPERKLMGIGMKIGEVFVLDVDSALYFAAS